MISIYLYAQTPAQLARWQDIFEKYLFINPLNAKIIFSATNPADLVIHIKTHPSQLGVFYISAEQNQPFSGFEVAKEIRMTDPRAYIVFLSSQPKLRADVFKHHIEALDFIVENTPEMALRMTQSLEAAAKNRRLIPKDAPLNREISLRISGEPMYIEPGQIIYIKIAEDRHKLELHLDNRTQMVRGSIRDFARQLDANHFYRCHNTHLINIDHISDVKLREHTIIMDNGAKIPYSARKHQGLMELMDKRNSPTP